VLADPLLRVRLQACILELLRLRRAALHEPDRREDDQAELEKLGLPVLHHVAPELGGHEEPPVGVRLAAVRALLLVEVVQAGERLADEREREDHQEEEREALLLDPGAHQWCVTPITV
jgi:hypothetical protein